MKIEKTDEELVALIQGGVDVQENTALLLEQCRGYLRSMAKKYPRSAAYDIEDLVQEGFLGLIKAVEVYKYVEGIRFLSYAKYHVQKRMYVFSQKMRYSASLSERQIDILSKYHRLKNDGKSRDEIKNLFEMDERKYKKFELLIQALDSISIYDSYLGHSDITYADSLTDEVDITELVLDDVYQSECEMILRKYVDALPKKQSQVITERYWNNKTMAEISKMREVHSSTIYELEESALKSLSEIKEIRALRDNYDYQDAGLKGVGFAKWKETGESSVERAVFCKMNVEQKLKQLTQKKRKYLEEMFQRPIETIMPYILELPIRALEVFIMRNIDDLKNTDVASILGIPKQNVSSNNQRAISKIKEALSA